MACKGCEQKFQGRCDSCFLVNGIEKIQEVFYCETCNAYICNACKTDWIKRAEAYFLLKASVVLNTVKEIFTGKKKKKKKRSEGSEDIDTQTV